MDYAAGNLGEDQGRDLIHKEDLPMTARAEVSSTTLPDGVLIQQALAGNQRAFEALVLRYRSMLFYAIYPCLHDFHEAQDTVQDVFLQLFRSLATIRVDGSLKSWLFTVARNRCLDRLRRKRPSYFSEIDLGPEDEGSLLDALVDADPLPEEWLEQREQAQRLRQAIGSLPAKYRLVVMLRYETKMSYRAIGQALHIPESTVKTQFHRAKRLLRSSVPAS
jgi:RNA polymerase sigma factor (sigma-70 family)